MDRVSSGWRFSSPLKDISTLYLQQCYRRRRTTHTHTLALMAPLGRWPVFWQHVMAQITKALRLFLPPLICPWTQSLDRSGMTGIKWLSVCSDHICTCQSCKSPHIQVQHNNIILMFWSYQPWDISSFLWSYKLLRSWEQLSTFLSSDSRISLDLRNKWTWNIPDYGQDLCSPCVFAKALNHTCFTTTPSHYTAFI